MFQILGFNTLPLEKSTYFQSKGWESMDVGGQLYPLLCAILYKGREALRSLVSAVGPRTNPVDTEG